MLPQERVRILIHSALPRFCGSQKQTLMAGCQVVKKKKLIGLQMDEEG